MKNFKRILALVLAVMMVATSVVAISAAEADEKVVFNAEAITRLNKIGIFQGYNANEMGENDNVTRAQMALFTGRVLTGKVESNYWESYVNDTTFEDIDEIADYYVGAIAYAYENGVVIGKSDVAFDPNGNVTYQEALTMVVRSLGYTGLSYPNGFINKAMKLGLTNGIANVAYGDAAVRGVIATILYNALYAEESLFADNFNLTSGTYMLVATPTVVKASGLKIPGASINGYIGKELNEGYVAFAPIGKDNKTVNAADKYVYARVSQIADDLKGYNVDEHYADKLGYAFNLTFENNVLTWGNECASKKFVNYGDNREITITEIDYDHRWENGAITWDDDYFLTFGNQAYNLVDGTKADYNAPTATQDLILYADYGMESASVADYVQTFAGNDIVDENGNILLKWNDTLKCYFKQNLRNANFDVKATAEDILAAVACYDDTLLSDYATIQGGDVIAEAYNNSKLGTDEIINNNTTVGHKYYDANFNIAAHIASNYFCEITAMDYDGDGLYDAAIYTPYYLGRIENVTEKDGNSKNGKEFEIAGLTIDGAANGKEASHVNDYTFTGVSKEPVAWRWCVYSYNRLTNEINLKEFAQSVSGKVEWGVKGQVNPASYIYEDSQVSIGGKTYQVGGWYYNNLYGLKVVKDFDPSLRKAIAPLMGLNADQVTSTYYNGWNDVLDFGMTDACAGFKGYAIAGHLIHGVPTPSAAADYAYVAFNAYQSEFALENDQIVVDAIVDASGKYQTIKINSIDSMEFTELEYQIFVAYCNVLYKDVQNKISVYSYYFDADRLATHQATPLYKAIERDFIIDRLTSNYVDVDGDELAEIVTADKASTLVYAVGGKNEDGSYKLYNYTDTTKGEAANNAVVEFYLGVSDVKIAASSSAKPIRTNANTVFTFVAKDGIYTYVGMPKNGYQIDLTNAPAKAVIVADSNNIMIIDTTRCITDIATVDMIDYPEVAVDWTEKVQDVALDYVKEPGDCTCGDGETIHNDNPKRCDAIYRNHLDTWAFVEYVPYVEATFHPDEVYMVTGKTANTKIYYDAGEMYYVYSGLYNLVDCKYEESVIFTGDEVAVFKAFAAALDTWYENGQYVDVATNYGVVITRDGGVVNCMTYANFKDAANENVVFNLEDAFNNKTNLNRGVYGGKLTDNTGAVSHVKIDGEYKTVNKVEFVTVYNTAGVKEVGTFANIANNAVIFYTYDAVAGVLTGYAFN